MWNFSRMKIWAKINTELSILIFCSHESKRDILMRQNGPKSQESAERKNSLYIFTVSGLIEAKDDGKSHWCFSLNCSSLNSFCSEEASVWWRMICFCLNSFNLCSKPSFIACCCWRSLKVKVLMYEMCVSGSWSWGWYQAFVLRP